ncbi:MAG: ATP-binding protein [Pleurocapsa sp. SU_196_0]|nr:ATP-binding protein [Pleurocapsa sp. SU_196_0]
MTKLYHPAVKRATLHLVCGLPGAGKTTLARRLEIELGAVRLCPDEWMEALGVSLFDTAFRDRLEGKLTELARDILRQGGNAIIEFGSWSKAERGALRSLAVQCDAAVHLYWLEVRVAELARRVRERGGAEAAALTEAFLQGISEAVERPSDAEGLEFDHFERIQTI